MIGKTSIMLTDCLTVKEALSKADGKNYMRKY